MIEALRVVDFHFDFLSPYAYLAWTQIHALAARHGATVRPVPTLLAALLAHGQTRGPAEIPAKRVYVWVDTLRHARLLGVPLQPPPAHPFSPLLALRACAVVANADGAGEEQRRLIDALFGQTWGADRDVASGCDTAEKVGAAAARAGLDADVVLARANDEAGKALLRKHTDEAIAVGVFGVPTLRAGPGPTNFFWGVDSLAALERNLAGHESVGDDDIAGWQHLPAAVHRI